MSLGRELPRTNKSCQIALNAATAIEKKSTSENTILSVATKERLIKMNDNFNTAVTNVIEAEQAQRVASEDADTNRTLSRIFIGCYFSTLNNGIRLNKIPRDARAFYDLDISNNRMPDINTDECIIECGQLVIDGDAKRVLGGGAAMAYPTILEFTPVFTAVKSAISAFSTSKSNLINAQAILNNLRTDAKAVCLKVYNELETYYSDLEMPARRAVGRIWGEKFSSKGKPATIVGIVTNAAGLPISCVEFYLQGVGVKFISGIDGRYAVNTTLNGDLILFAKSPGYKDSQTDLMMADGGNLVINIVMESH